MTIYKKKKTKKILHDINNKLKMTCWKTGITSSCIYPYGYATLIESNGTLCPKGLSQKGYQYCHP